MPCNKIRSAAAPTHFVISVSYTTPVKYESIYMLSPLITCSRTVFCWSCTFNCLKQNPSLSFLQFRLSSPLSVTLVGLEWGSSHDSSWSGISAAGVTVGFSHDPLRFHPFRCLTCHLLDLLSDDAFVWSMKITSKGRLSSTWYQLCYELFVTSVFLSWKHAPLSL